MPETNTVFIVQLVHTDSSITYAGKESWEENEQPSFVMSLSSANGKARWWKKVSNAPGKPTNLTHINIIPVDIIPQQTIGRVIECQ